MRQQHPCTIEQQQKKNICTTLFLFFFPHGFLSQFQRQVYEVKFTLQSKYPAALRYVV